MAKIKEKPVIAIDLDDVVSSQTAAVIAYVNKHYGTRLTMDDFKAPGDYWGYFETVIHNDRTEGKRIFTEFLDTRQPYGQIVEPEVIRALEQLKERGYKLEIVTSRSLDWQVGTIEWLEKHAPSMFSNIHFVDLWNKGSEKATKAAICMEIGAGYLIDDNVEHCNLAAEAGVHALLFGEYGWNLHQNVHPDVVRVKDWSKVLDYFNDIR